MPFKLISCVYDQMHRMIVCLRTKDIRNKLTILCLVFLSLCDIFCKHFVWQWKYEWNGSNPRGVLRIWNWPFLQHIYIYVPPVTLIRPDPIVPKLRRSVKPDNHFAAVTPSNNTVWLMYTRADQEWFWLMICTPCFPYNRFNSSKLSPLPPLPLVLESAHPLTM